MRVTEGKASSAARRSYWIMALVISAACTAFFAAWPGAGVPFLWCGAVIGAGMVVRNVLLSVLARLIPGRRFTEPPVRYPSIAFVIPSLNERPSLERTLPALQALRYPGELRFCYVCEGASTDGTRQYVQAVAAQDPRVVAIPKDTPPAGRGAAVQHGLDRAPASDVIGLLDADHLLDQDSLDELARAFGRSDGPVAVEGSCEASNPRGGALARLLTVEREWLEGTEMRATPALGGLTQFGGGQGFFRRELLSGPQFRVDPSMVLDDTDMSLRLACAGYRVAFDPHVVTRSRQPESFAEFMDQRFRWTRGWLQVALKHAKLPFGPGRASLGVRADIVRLMLIPFAGVIYFLSLAAGVGAVIGGPSAWGPTWLVPVVLLWPMLMGPLPYVAGAPAATPRRLPLVLLGVPLLFYSYAILFAVGAVDAGVLRRPLRYAKTSKPV